jgi:hypothetical protein
VSDKKDESLPMSEALAAVMRGEISVPEHNLLVLLEDCRRAYLHDGNPLYVWAALRELLRPRGPLGHADPVLEYRELPQASAQAIPLAPWVADYLWAAARDLVDLAMGRDPARRPAADSEALWDWLATARNYTATNDDAVAALGFAAGKGRSSFRDALQAWREDSALNAYESAEARGADAMTAAMRAYSPGKEVDESTLAKKLREARARRAGVAPEEGA